MKPNRLPAEPAPDIGSDDILQGVYNWVDSVPLSRPKRNIARDFSDGVLLAEVIHHHFPSIIELHNYSAANSVSQKEYNWKTINSKVLRKLGINLHEKDMDDAVNARRGAIERILAFLQVRFEQQRNRQGPEVDSAREGNAPGRQESRPRAEQTKKQASPSAGLQHEVDTEILVEKEQTIHELREIAMVMQEKVRKLEQLLRIKDSKIDALMKRLEQYEAR
mmetsp:Transcript_10565/g.26876  ORF Transcript_10565/g.26876 Transcript_10565/m.26876 type:complete len:221 (+) Transcript_10565:19-681(+)